MKSTRLMLGLLVCLLTYACQKTEKTTGQLPSQTVVTEQKSAEIIRDTMTNNDGLSLYMTFDNANHTARFVLKGQIIELQQNTRASGINYSNSDYEFLEHQGEGRLKKNGNIIFSYKKKPVSE